MSGNHRLVGFGDGIMSNYCFITPEAQALVESVGILQNIQEFSENNKKQTYVLCKPLSKDDSSYDYDEACVIFISGMKPCFINTGGDEDGFDDYIDDFYEDVSFLSEKYQYRKKIGRKKKWHDIFERCDFDELDFEQLSIDNPTDKRVADLITSLVIGSINDVSKVNLEAESLLDVVKSKIVLFDTDQTGFVFKIGANKKYVIQGLAGSGKTELLLHKLKEIYSNEDNARIAFTCHNKILASSMRSRIPEFFNFMKVERQIEWESKIFCFSSWGSGRNPTSGMYRYICSEYEISFGTLQAGSFDFLCKKAINEIKNNQKEGEVKYIFDYVFIDESQDFDESFIELCELVTEKKVFVAGDVFQNIFRPIDDDVRQADLLLKKCYRTDPRNLMFSHALGMGLYEKPVLRWLKDNEWDACGYNYEQHGERAIVSRDPLRRFEDIPDQFRATSLTQVDDDNNIAESIFTIVEKIRAEHENVCPGDIAVLFLDTSKYIYNVIPELSYIVSDRLGWDVNISYESKVNDSGKFFISNINNAKGLEFPFVICFAMNLNKRTSFRNGLYTMMARSFLESHLVLGTKADSDLINKLNAGLDCMYTNGYMDLRVPSDEEIESQQAVLVWDEKPTIEALVTEFCEQHEASPRLKAKLLQRMTEILSGEEYDNEYFNSLIEVEYKRNVKL
jgi:superfamily I DNA and RNA helicase